MAVIEIRTNDGQVIDQVTVEDVTEPLDNARVWAFHRPSLGEIVIRRAELALAYEMGHPQGSRTAFVEDTREDAKLTTGRDARPLMHTRVGNAQLQIELELASAAGA